VFFDQPREIRPGAFIKGFHDEIGHLTAPSPNGLALAAGGATAPARPLQTMLGVSELRQIFDRKSKPLPTYRKTSNRLAHFSTDKVL